MVGFEVTPRMPSSTSSWSRPSLRYPRVRLSSQGLWPCASNNSCRRVRAAMPATLCGLCLLEEQNRRPETMEKVPSPDRSELAGREESAHRDRAQRLLEHGG